VRATSLPSSTSQTRCATSLNTTRRPEPERAGRAVSLWISGRVATRRSVSSVSVCSASAGSSCGCSPVRVVDRSLSSASGAAELGRSASFAPVEVMGTAPAAPSTAMAVTASEDPAAAMRP
jgi:hypothetical protein